MPKPKPKRKKPTKKTYYGIKPRQFRLEDEVVEQMDRLKALFSKERASPQTRTDIVRYAVERLYLENFPE